VGLMIPTNSQIPYRVDVWFRDERRWCFILSNRENQEPFHFFTSLRSEMQHIAGVNIGRESGFMLTFTLHRIITMWHNNTSHNVLQLFILFFQAGYERSKISRCNLSSCCYTDVNAKPEPKVNTILKDVNMSSKEQISSQFFFSRIKGVKDLVEFHSARWPDLLSMQIVCAVLISRNVCISCESQKICNVYYEKIQLFFDLWSI